MEKEEHSLANISIGFAVASLVVFPLFFGLAAFVLGIIATARGDDRGIWGIILSVVCPAIDIYITWKLMGII